MRFKTPHNGSNSKWLLQKTALSAMLLAGLLSACSQNTASDKPEAKQTETAAVTKPTPQEAAPKKTSRLYYATSVNVGVDQLNPHLYSPNQMFGQAMVYESLVKYRSDGTVEPWLATSWEMSEDGKAYTFKLRQGVKFSNGEPFNAEAVKKSMEAVMVNAKRHAWLELMNQLDRIEVVDDATVRIHIKSSYYPFLQDMSLIRPLRIIAPSSIPESGNTADGIKSSIGTGPWVVVEMRKGEHDLFKRNEHYWGKKPVFDELMFKVLPDPSTRALALQSGQVDLVYGDGVLLPDAIQQFKAQGDKYQVSISEPLSTRMLALNSKRFPTNDLAVRQAISHAVDKEAIIKNVLYDLEKRADLLYASNVPYADLGLKPLEYNVEKAAKILDNAGWKLAAGETVRMKNGKPLAVDLCFIGKEAKDKAIAEVVQANLAQIGVQVNLIGEDPSSKGAREKDGTFHLIFNSTWGAPYEPHAFASSMRRPAHADYQAQSGLPMKAEIDARISKVLLSTDEAQRVEDWKWILTTLHEQVVYLPISYQTLVSVSNKDKLRDVPFGATKYEVPFENMQPVQ